MDSGVRDPHRDLLLLLRHCCAMQAMSIAGMLLCDVRYYLQLLSCCQAFNSIYPPPGTWGLWALPGEPNLRARYAMSGTDMPHHGPTQYPILTCRIASYPAPGPASFTLLGPGSDSYLPMSLLCDARYQRSVRCS
eukprot:231607-Rhodomonas_salina.3